MPDSEKKVLLDVQNLKTYFSSGHGRSKHVVKAVDDVSFRIFEGETFGLVGESGCGKTTTGRTIIRLYEPTGGEVYFDGKKISGKMSKDDLRSLTRNMQMIFQDPVASLNPRMTIEEIVSEGLRVGGMKDRAQRLELVYAILDKVGLTILFIAHNLSVVKYFSDRIGVMYMGKLVEVAEADDLYRHPIHPYTRSLLSAIPQPDPLFERRRVRIPYDPSIHPYDREEPQYYEILPGHRVYASPSEYERYQKELGLR